MVSAGVAVNRLNDRIFSAIYNRSLVYNTCWEDPAVDREVLGINQNDNMLVISSAGCNVLDYALDKPNKIYAVDSNPRQNALLELKLAGIKKLEYDDFFQLFGKGGHREWSDVYNELIRDELSEFAVQYWDRNAKWFDASGSSKTFYFRGLSGHVARAFTLYLKMRPKLRDGIGELIEASSLDQQREIYDRHVREQMWSRKMNWLLSRQFTMNMLGVPHPQRKEVENQHQGGVAGFIREAIEYVFRELPIWSNYFWIVYLRGSYTQNCCPEYLRKDNFLALKNGLAGRIEQHTCTITQFLDSTRESISKFVLLDHMDWMSSYLPHALIEEWQAISDKSDAHARLIFRSAHANPHYLENISVSHKGRSVPIFERYRFNRELANVMQRSDRVHTYAGFHIADRVT